MGGRAPPGAGKHQTSKSLLSPRQNLKGTRMTSPTRIDQTRQFEVELTHGNGANSARGHNKIAGGSIDVGYLNDRIMELNQ